MIMNSLRSLSFIIATTYHASFIHSACLQSSPCLVVDVEVDPLLHLGPERPRLAGVLADVQVARGPDVERRDVREAAVICGRRRTESE